MKLGELLDLPRDFTINFSLSKVQYMSVVLICTVCCTLASVLTESNGKSTKTEVSAKLCDCSIAAPLVPMKSHLSVLEISCPDCCWSNFTQVLLEKLF